MIEIKNLDVVFDPVPQPALTLLDEGKDREQVREETGLVVGVRNASLSVEKGEICVLMGLSGSGKSSLLRCVNGLNPISRGSVNLKIGEEWVDFAQASESTQREIRRRNVSMVFQKFALMPWLTVEQNVAMPLELQGLSREQVHERVMEQLELVGLSEWAKLKPASLSGGMQQRVGLARALVTASDILLMDEPFSALDPLIRAQLQDELLILQEKLHKTIIFVSHDLDEALKLGTHIAIMKDAEIVQHGKPQEIVVNPADDYVRSFVSHTNPLNVLLADAIMQPLSELTLHEKGYCLNRRYQYWLAPDHGFLLQGESKLNIVPRLPDQTIDVLPNTPVAVDTQTPIKDVMEIRHHTGHPVLIHAKGDSSQLVGYIADRQLYHAMLGKLLEED